LHDLHHDSGITSEGARMRHGVDVREHIHPVSTTVAV